MDRKEGMTMQGSSPYYFTRVMSGAAEQVHGCHFTGPPPGFRPINPNISANANAIIKPVCDVEEGPMSQPSNNEPPQCFSITVASAAGSLSEPTKRKRGRPRKYWPARANGIVGLDSVSGSLSEPTKRKRGRPRKDWPARANGIVGPDTVSGTPGDRKKRGRPPGSGRKQRLASVGETPGASQEHSRISPQPLPEGGQCSNGAKNNKEWDSDSLMKAIIKKHGDITKSCNFQSQIFKTNCLEGICKIVKKLQETRIADVNPSLLKELYSFIKDAERVNLDVKWLRKHVDEAEEAMSSLAKELERLERAERELGQQNEEIKEAIEVKRVEVAKLQSEIEVKENELAVGILSSKDLKAQKGCIKSRYHCSYVMESFI